MSDDLTRRGLLRAVPSAVLPVLLGLPALASAISDPASTLYGPDTPILRLYREQERLTLAFNTGSGDEATDRTIFEDLLEAERQMADAPCTCIADLAAKVLMLTQIRDTNDTPYTRGLLAEMEALVTGVPA